jgi:hypothetical protein
MTTLGVQEIIIPKKIASKVLIGDRSRLPESHDKRILARSKFKRQRRGQGRLTSFELESPRDPYSDFGVHRQALNGWQFVKMPAGHSEIDVARIFKVRSPERDAQTDRERFGSLARSINSAVDAVRAERDALRVRVDEARDRASLAAGTDLDDYLARDPADTARLREYEQQMVAGDRRIGELDRQLEGLHALSEVYGRFFSGGEKAG